VKQTEYRRDEDSPSSRLFDYLVAHINSSIEMKNDQLLNTSILDI
jgi:hypothetical protein